MPPEFRDLDLMAPDTHSGNPWPMYDWLREEQRMYWDSINELWCVARYDDIVNVAKQPTLFTSTQGNVPKMPPDASFINLDGKGHRNRRNLISAYFTQSAIRKMEEHILEAVDQLIDEVIEAGACDFVEDIAAPLPVRLIGEPENRSRKAESSRSARSASFGASSSSLDISAGSLVMAAYLFHGQTARQSSQP